MTPEMLAKADRARKFLLPIPEDPTDVGPDPDPFHEGDATPGPEPHATPKRLPE
jgi:hypothetical protein